MKFTRRAWFGLAVAVIFALAGAAAPWVAPYDPYSSSVDALAGLSPAHWMGTDALGRDVFSLVIYGARTSLFIGIGGAALATLIGVPVGLIAGYFRGKIDRVIVWIIDLFISMPVLVLALILSSVMTPSVGSLVAVLGFVMWPSMARLVRGQTLAVREMVFVEAARAIGGTWSWIISTHIWPNVARIVAAQFSVAVSVAIFTSASLSFLGLGIPPPTAEWGGLVRAGFDYLTINPIISIGPGLAVSLAVASFYLIGSSAR